MKVHGPTLARAGGRWHQEGMPQDLAVIMSVGSDPIRLTDALTLVAIEIEKIQATVRLLRAAIDQAEAEQAKGDQAPSARLNVALGQVRELGRQIEDHVQTALAHVDGPVRAIPGIE